MNLHSKIMNLSPLSGVAAPNHQYSLGHRDARRAAAELAAEHEAMCERMAEAFEDCIDAAENSGGCTDGMAEALQEIRETSRKALAAYREHTNV